MLGTCEFQFYISAIITGKGCYGASTLHVSILHKCDYNDLLVRWIKTGIRVSILHKCDYNMEMFTYEETTDISFNST